MIKFFRHHLLGLLFFIALIAVSIFMRFYNLNWDSGYLFHPDERNIANAVTKVSFFSQLNPQFFAYGGFSIYVYRFAADMLVFFTHDTSWVHNWGDIDIIGRFFSALFSSLTLIPLYFLTRKVFNRQTAIIATLFYAFSVSAIQIAHFATTDSLLTCEGVLLGLLGMYLYHAFSWKLLFVSAVVVGISVATKTSALLFVVFPVLGTFLPVFHKKNESLKMLAALVVFGFISLAVFTLFSPYTFLDYKDFIASMNYESGVATGSLPVVYTLQFNGSIPYVFQLMNFFWQIGLLAPFGVLGVFLTFYHVWKTRHLQYVVFLSFPLIYFFYVGSWHTKFLRYMLPFLPFYVIMASAWLIWLQKRVWLFSHLLIGFLLFATTLWAFAFFHIYQVPQTRIVASQWMYTHIPAGNKILTEAWDDGLPIGIDNNTPQQYNIEQLNMYDPDSTAKMQYLANELASANYIIFNSRRLYGTLIRLTKEYPLTSQYYKKLFAGTLGYTNIATFASYPAISGITVIDDSSEETFQVYDHPKVIIFENTAHLSQQQLFAILKK
ncbi:MAG TPA: glycosyltransferase family 39 protein [Patescibacteria group bacterium]|nr:glycosyltransferase family 39 protein [Patescibacteria group bacterium]